MENSRESMGMCIKLARIKAGLKQAALAKDVGVSTTTVHKWENDKAVPSVEHAIGICKAVGQSLDGVFYPLYQL